MMEGQFLALDTCYLHGEIFEFNPDTVTTIWIDPQTNRPADVGEDARPCTPDPEAERRQVQRPICDKCIRQVNVDRKRRFPQLAPLPLAGDQS